MEDDEQDRPSPVAVADETSRSDQPPPLAASAAAASDDRVVGGVCGFIGHRLGVDPLWVRLTFVTTALVGGIGLVAYIGLWLAFRSDDSGLASIGRMCGAMVMIGGLPLVIVNSGGQFLDGPPALIALLAGLAVSLWRPRGAKVDVRTLAVPVPQTSTREPRPAREPREHSPLGRMCLAGATVVAAAGAMIDQANGGRLHPEQWLGAAAAVCGVGLVIGSVVGRARWLIIPAAGFVVAGYVTGQLARLDIPLSNVAGNRYLTISRASSDTAHVIRRGFADESIYIDHDIDQDHRVRAVLFAGSVSIVVPDDVRVEVHADLVHGDVSLDGVEQTGEDVRVGPSTGRLVVIDATVVFGDIDIWRYSNEPTPGPDTADATANLGTLTAISDGVSVTSDGYVVLGNGEAVIDPSDNVITGGSGQSDRSHGATSIVTGFGEFTLLPRSLLLDPNGTVLDLQVIRAAQANTVPPTAPTAPPVVTSPVPPTGEVHA